MLTAIGAGEGASGRGAGQPLPRRLGGRPVDRSAHRRGDRRQTLLPSLELGVESKDTFLETLVTHMCYGPVDQNDQYKRAMPIRRSTTRCRSTRASSAATQAGTPEQILAALQNRKSVLDYVSSDYNDLKSKLGAEDGAKLDQHLTNIRSIEDRLTG